MKCKNPLDVVFIVDGSLSMGSTEFNTIKKFIGQVSRLLEISDSAAQVAVIEFSSTSDTEIKIGPNENKNLTELLKKIDSLSPNRGIGGAIGTALKLVNDKVRLNVKDDIK